MMDKCIHNKGYCEILSDNEVKQPCIEGPCMGGIKECYECAGVAGMELPLSSGVKRVNFCPMCGRKLVI
jgi:hypothetical protein